MSAKLRYVNLTMLPERLKCSICSQIFEKPTRLPCGHLNCESCISLWMKSHKSCPVCRIPLVKNKLKPDLLAQNILDEFEIYCPFYEKGCDEIRLKKEMKLHSEVCELKNIPSSMLRNRVVEETGDDILDERLQKETSGGLLAKVLKNNLKAKGLFIRCVIRSEKRDQSKNVTD